jgi:hypothetical protein
MRFLQLSLPRQALVRMCQTVNHGQIKELHVRDSEPVYDPPPLLVFDTKLNRDDNPRPELELADFELRADVLRLMAQLDRAESGVFQRIEVQAGLPQRVLLESRVAWV